MSLQKSKQQGFTIVELLIVVVVIGVLAAIVIVAYNGITQSANATAARANASAVQKVAEAYNADTGSGYPATTAALTSWNGVARIPNGVTVVTTQLTSAHADGSTIQYRPDAGGATGGGCVGYWDASLATPAAAYLYVGTATTGVNGSTPSCN